MRSYVIHFSWLLHSACNPRPSAHPGTPTILVLCSSQRTCDVLAEYLACYDRTKEKGERGRKMMERRLRRYLGWKGGIGNFREGARPTFRTSTLAPPNLDTTPTGSDGSTSATPRTSTYAVSEALRKKDEEKRRRNMNRRRIRGGAPGAVKREETPALSGIGSTAANDAQADTEMELVGGMSGKEREKLGLLVGEGEMRKEVENLKRL